MPHPEAPDLVLASRSAARIGMLTAAGLRFRVHPAGLDERALTLQSGSAEPAAIAAALALAKARHAGAAEPGALIIGADQVLELDGGMLAKPADRGEAQAQLGLLSGRAHLLHSAAACVEQGGCVWRHTATARLVMRPLSDASIGRYLDAAGAAALASVGAYQLEGLGVNLFEEIEGDYFTILGLPLLPLLAFLRQRGLTL
jgi:septum formation protein